MPRNLLTRLYRPLPALLVTCSLLGTTGAQANEPVSEQVASAALLFNFIKLTEWPETHARQDVMDICVLTTDQELFAAIEQLDTRKIRNQLLKTKRYREQEECDVIFTDARQRWNSLPAKSRQAALTVGKYAGFVDDGGIIELSMQEEKPRFDINLAAAKRAGLRLYPQLLKLARRVVE